MSEATQGVQPPSISHLAWVKVCQFLTVLAWLAAGVVTAVDALDPGFPSPITAAALSAAVAVTAVCAVLWAQCRSEEARAASDAAILQRIELLAAVPVLPPPLLARVRQPAPGGRASRSAYWAVYRDIMDDLGGLDVDKDEDPGPSN